MTRCPTVPSPGSTAPQQQASRTDDRDPAGKDAKYLDHWLGGLEGLREVDVGEREVAATDQTGIFIPHRLGEPKATVETIRRERELR